MQQLACNIFSMCLYNWVAFVLASDDYCRKCLDLEIIGETCEFTNSVGSQDPTRNYFEVE